VEENIYIYKQSKTPTNTKKKRKIFYVTQTPLIKINIVYLPNKLMKVTTKTPKQQPIRTTTV
jgi:hypothetical protein